MPFTPYHFGPHACIALPFSRYIDIPAFILANVIIDFEPLVAIIAMMKFGVDLPMHSYFHSFLLGSVIALLWAVIAYYLRGFLQEVMKVLHVKYQTHFKKILYSSILGVWLHVLFDAPLYNDIRPFYPSSKNPLYGLLSHSTMYKICAICFIPAFIFTILSVISYSKQNKSTHN